MTTRTATATSVTEYISGFSPEIQVLLERVRHAAKRGAPDAEEVISYRMPALKHNGILIYFAAFKRHIGVFPPFSGDPAIEEAVAPYAGPKGNLRFPYDQPIPYGLIESIVRSRAEQHAAKNHSARVTGTALRAGTGRAEGTEPTPSAATPPTRPKA